MYYPSDVEAWEIEQWNRLVCRLYKTQKNYRYPRQEKLRDFRNHGKGSAHFNHETKFIRTVTNRQFRRKGKPCSVDEECIRPVPHEYKTYGWLTW